MRKLALLAVILIAVNFAACGDGEPTDDNGTLTDVLTDQGGVDVVEDTAVEDVVEDTGTDTAWMDMGLQDLAEDIPEGPFYPKEEGDLVTVTNGTITVVLNLAAGTFNIGTTPGLDGVINGHSEAHIDSVEGTTVITSLNPSQRAGWLASWDGDGLDEGVTLMMETIPSGSIGGLRTYISLHRNSPSVTVKLMLALPIREGFLIKKLIPVVARGSEGAGLLLGPGTSSAMMVTNGHEIAYDGNAEALNVTEAIETLNAPGYLSNWNATICTKAGKCVIAGFLDVERGFGGVAVESSPLEAFAVGDDAALSLFELRSTLIQGAYVSPSRIITSEMAYLDFTDNAYEGLARFGAAIKTYNALADKRNAPVMMAAPVDLKSMNSDDVAALAVDAAAYNVAGMLIDLGWQDDEQNPDTTNFPNEGSENAMKWLAGEITDRGLLAGIALSPFVFDAESDFYTAHPDWMLAPTELAVVRLGLGNNAGILDLSNAAAAAWALAYIKTAVQTWGYGYVKLYGVDIACLGDGGTVGQTGLTAMITFLKSLRTELGAATYIEIAEGTMIGIEHADLISAAMPTYASWAAPASKVDGTLMMGAMSWSHRAFLNGNAFQVVPGRLFNMPDTRIPGPGEYYLGQQLAAVTGGVPNFAETLLNPGREYEATHPVVASLWSPDFMSLKIPETWYAHMDKIGGATYVAGFFRFADNMDLYTLAAVNGGRTRVFNVPDDTASWVALDVFDGSVLSVGGKCINPDGAEFTIDIANSARVFAIRSFDGVGPSFLGMTSTLAGGFTYATEIGEEATGAFVTLDQKDRGPTTVWFAVPKGSTPAVDVEGGSIDAQNVDNTTCSDMDLVSVTFTATVEFAVATVLI